jgi:hypothetical protein
MKRAPLQKSNRLSAVIQTRPTVFSEVLLIDRPAAARENRSIVVDSH